VKTFGTSLAIALAASLELAGSWSPAHSQGVLVNGARATGSIAAPGASDQWTFSANAGDAIVVRMGGAVAGGTLAPWLRIYSPTGALVGGIAGGFAAEVATNATVSGQYVAIASDGSGPRPGCAGSPGKMPASTLHASCRKGVRSCAS